VRRLTLLLILFTARVASAQLDVDVWLAKLDTSNGAFTVSDPINISHRAGYDNQPAFFPDESKLLYSTDAGGAIHTVMYDIATGAATDLPMSKGYSPTPTADGKSYMTLTEGAVLMHDLTGKTTATLTQTKDAGYYSRFDDRTWALFINDKERRIVIYDSKTNKSETFAKGAITPLYRIPGEKAVTFVEESPFSADPAEAAKIDPAKKKLLLRKLDVAHRKVETLAEIPFKTGGHHMWTTRGTIIIASGPQLYEWSPAEPDAFHHVFKFEDPDIQGITRIMISPKGDRIAFVSTPRDEVLIRDARIAMNDAIAAHQVDGVLAPLAENVTIVRGNGDVLSGAEAVKKAFVDLFAQFADAVYVRTTDRLDLSSAQPLAAEQGTWTGTWTTPDGVVNSGGTYLAMWRKSTSDSGTPQWEIASELYVTLR